MQNNLQDKSSGFARRRHTTNVVQSPFATSSGGPRPINLQLNQESQMHMETLKNYHQEFNESIKDDDSFFQG